MLGTAHVAFIYITVARGARLCRVFFFNSILQIVIDGFNKMFGDKEDTPELESTLQLLFSRAEPLTKPLFDDQRADWWRSLVLKPVEFNVALCASIQGLRAGTPAEPPAMVFGTPTRVLSEAGPVVDFLGANKVPDFQRFFQVMPTSQPSLNHIF